MIQDDIINELQHIPEANLQELYNLIHFYRLGLNSEVAQQSVQNENFAVDKSLCLDTLKRIKHGDFANFIEIDDIGAHIEKLRNEIS